MEGEEVITKVIHEQDSDYTFVGFQTNNMSTIKEAMQAVASSVLSETIIGNMLSVEGNVRATSVDVAYRKYVIEAYSGGAIVDRIVFICRYK